MSKWINVNDELPIENGQYLVKVPSDSFNRKGQAVSEFSKCVSPNFSYDRIHVGQVTHWMQLPEPPKK